jgi:hypothetical protein
MQDEIVSRRVTRFFAGLMISLGVLGGAAVGLAATAGATTGSQNPQGPNTTSTVRGPLIVATPNTTAPRWVPPPHRVVIIPAESFGE